MPRLCTLSTVLLLLVGSATGQIAGSGGPSGAVLAGIEIEGNTRTADWLVREVIGLQPGDPFSMTVYDEVWDRLEDCGYFAFVDLDTREDEPGEVTLLVLVEEERTTRLAPLIRHDRRHKYFLGATLAEDNLRGQGERLELQASVLYTRRLGLTWTKPWLFRRDGLTLSLDAGWHRAGFVYRPFDYTAWHATTAVRQAVGGAGFVQLGGGRESFDQHDAYTWDDGAGPVVHEAGRRGNWLLQALVGVDLRDNPFYPEQGLLATYEYAFRDGDQLDGQSSHTVDLRGYVPLPGPPVLALHGLLRAVDSPGLPEHVLRWGGATTVRGAPYARREGDRAYLATAELRWPLVLFPTSITGETLGAGLHAFVDVGDAFYDDPDAANPRALLSQGAGVHLSLGSLQLCFEAAKERDGDWTFEFRDLFRF